MIEVERGKSVAGSIHVKSLDGSPADSRNSPKGASSMKRVKTQDESDLAAL